jgi:hypothetical protein
VKVPAIFRLLVDNCSVMPISYAVIVALSTGVVAISASSLRTGEALIALSLLSLGLWGVLYLTACWLAIALLF